MDDWVVEAASLSAAEGLVTAGRFRMFGRDSLH
jgi:hypothetical protein